MKNTQKGFIVPLVIAIAIVVIAGGVYLYSQKVRPKIVNTEDQNIVNNNSESNIPTSRPSSNNLISGWKVNMNTQYKYQISYPPSNTLSAYKITPEINVSENATSPLCKSNQEMSGVQTKKINGIDFYVNPIQANGGEFVSVYTTVRNSFCYQIVFRIGDRTYIADSAETKASVDLVNQVMSTFKFI